MELWSICSAYRLYQCSSNPFNWKNTKAGLDWMAPLVVEEQRVHSVCVCVCRCECLRQNKTTYTKQIAEKEDRKRYKTGPRPTDNFSHYQQRSKAPQLCGHAHCEQTASNSIPCLQVAHSWPPLFALQSEPIRGSLPNMHISARVTRPNSTTLRVSVCVSGPTTNTHTKGKQRKLKSKKCLHMHKVWYEKHQQKLKRPQITESRIHMQVYTEHAITCTCMYMHMHTGVGNDM